MALIGRSAIGARAGISCRKIRRQYLCANPETPCARSCASVRKNFSSFTPTGRAVTIAHAKAYRHYDDNQIFYVQPKIFSSTVIFVQPFARERVIKTIVRIFCWRGHFLDAVAHANAIPAIWHGECSIGAALALLRSSKVRAVTFAPRKQNESCGRRSHRANILAKPLCSCVVVLMIMSIRQ
jgi:hypothetical protein